MDASTDRSMTKMEITEHFSKLFEDENNINCFQCSKKSRQWAQTKHALFLCLSCAANYKEISRVTCVKSISLDLWTEDELKRLKLGGNQRFKQFLTKFQFEVQEPKAILRSNAADYYRRLLIAEANGTELPVEPEPEIGRQAHAQEIPLTEMTSDQILKVTKDRLSWAGRQSKKLGIKAYDKVHHKVTSGELKEDAKKVGEKVSTTAKSVWAFMSSKIEELRKDKKPEEAREI